MPTLLLPRIDEGGRALDVHDVDRLPSRDDLSLVVGTRRPDLAPDADAAAVRADFLQHDGWSADQRGGSGTQHGRPPDVAQRERAGDAEPDGRANDERAQLAGAPPAPQPATTPHPRGHAGQAQPPP